MTSDFTPCQKFTDKSMHPSLRTCMEKIMSTDGGTDRQTVRVKPIYPQINI